MGWNDHVDWQLLDDLEEMIDAGILDANDPDNHEAKAIANAIEAVASYVDGHLVEATPAQKALFEKHASRLYERLEKEREDQWLDHLMSKDD